MNTRVEKGIFYISAASLSSALFGLFIKISIRNLPISFLLVMRFLIPLMICLPLFFIFNLWKKRFTFEGYKGHLLRAVLMVGSQYCYFFYLSKSTLLNAVLLLNTAPLFIPFISKFYYGDQSVKLFSKSLFISVVGVLFIVQPDQSIFVNFSLIGLLSGILLAFSQSIYGKNIQDQGIEENLFFVFSIASLLSVGVLFLFFNHNLHEGLLNLFSQSKTDWICVFFAGGFTTLNQYFRGIAYRYLKPHLLSPLMNLAIFFSFIFDVFILKNTPDYLSIVGSLLIVLGSLLKWKSIRKQV